MGELVQEDWLSPFACRMLSNQVLFISPYFGHGKRKYCEPLKRFLAAIASRGQRRVSGKIEYHTRMFGHGLDQDDSRPTGYDTVSLLDEKTCSDLLADHSDHSAKLTWLNDTFSVTG